MESENPSGRLSVIGKVRAGLRRRFFAMFARALATNDGRELLARALQGRFAPGDFGFEITRDHPYEELPAPMARRAPVRPAPLFITGRFRSGSTLLWNVFRRLDGYTSYYEPLNERRWFDPRSRGGHTDSSHRNVTDYWAEYEGLEAELSPVYREEWIQRSLYLEPQHAESDLERYIDVLIARARGTAVLQFNRVDFRLPWLRAHYPDAKILHVYRHPRDQWCSSLIDLGRYPANSALHDFGPADKYYLRAWVRDLKAVFPALQSPRIDHAYDWFYLLWRLSYSAGIAHADVSVAMEEIVSSPRDVLARLGQRLGLAGAPLEDAASVVETPKLRRWREYAPDAWFEEREAKCEALLGEMRPECRRVAHRQLPVDAGSLP